MSLVEQELPSNITPMMAGMPSRKRAALKYAGLFDPTTDLQDPEVIAAIEKAISGLTGGADIGETLEALSADIYSK